ncbi:asparagine synthase B [bacterium]|nr:asparagine synthase B [bacterium]
MCGIAGIWGDEDKELVKTMMNKMVHRGPDAEGMYVSPIHDGVLGHRRLSIMDPTGGDQPILNADKKRVIVANGEIYNYPDLLPTLTTKYDFKTTSDSEAILHLYQEHGTGVVKYLDGMYAFAISDEKNILAARDPIGIKPLYYAESDGKFVFGSELKAIMHHSDDIHEFPPGTYYHSKQGFQSFYEVPKLPVEEHSVDYWLREIRETLEKSVTKRLMSDVPLGTFLSGGLDSSLISAIVRQHVDELHTFSVGFEGSPDLAAARLVSEHLGTIHHEYILTMEEIIAKLPEIIYYLESFDQDLVRSGIPCFFTSRLASEYVKVILTGEGADELFAGYTYYKDIQCDEFLHEELRRSVSALHNVNLQRVDRMTMAQSIEGRVPFLDLKMIELGLRIPSAYCLYGDPPIEKWILRKACEDLLPEEIIWRKKEQFDEGSGAAENMDKALREIMTPAQAEQYAKEWPGTEFRSPEECYYHQVLVHAYDNPAPILANVGRWSDRPEEETA